LVFFDSEGGFTMATPNSPTAPQAPAVAPWRRRFAYLFVFLVSVGLGVVGTMLLFNIRERKEEAKQHFFKLVELDETTVDPAIWGKNFPRQYDSYKRTVDIEQTRHGGSEAIDKLAKYPMLKRLYAGYAFSIDFREERGHAYMLDDQDKTKRVTERKQPGACLQCHAAILPAYREVGKAIVAKEPVDGKKKLSPEGLVKRELMKGFESVCGMDWAEGRKLVSHPVSCQDCHDPKSAQLRVTRPGFLIGIDALAKSDDQLPHLPSLMRWRKLNKDKIETWRKRKDKKSEVEEFVSEEHPVYDPNKEASRQEMRSFVCGQCHVEYYFKPDTKAVTYPWSYGLKVDDIYKYYEQQKFSDWTHAETKAKVLKAQHPEFELWNQGTHARAGVSCADCHMPYTREGAVKVSDHWVRSPLLNMSRACQTCHRQEEGELKARVDLIQDRTEHLLDLAQVAVIDLIDAIKDAQATGVSAEIIGKAQGKQRKAQFYLDFVFSENSFGFHAAQESARILAEAIDQARQGQLLLPRKNDDK